MRTVSWVLLLIVGFALLVFSFISAGVAYRAADDQIGPITLNELSAGRADVSSALRGRRGTAAGYAAAFAALFLFVVWVPYRRGEVWSWWALLVSLLVLAGVVLARVPLIGTKLGAAAALIILGVVVVALLLDVKRLRA